MIKVIVTNAVISKGYDGAEAVRFATSGENKDKLSVRFRIGERVYDSRADDNHRYVNLNVKAFNYIAERIQKMNLGAGSYVNIVGRYDEETWDDKKTGEQRSASVLIVDEIEYTHGNAQNGAGNGGSQNGSGSGNSGKGAGAANGGGMPDNFGGFLGADGMEDDDLPF